MLRINADRIKSISNINGHLRPRRSKKKRVLGARILGLVRLVAVKTRVNVHNISPVVTYPKQIFDLPKNIKNIKKNNLS